MKKLQVMLCAACVWAWPALAQDQKGEVPPKIGAAEAGDHLNEALVVTGKVAQVTIREKIVYLNLDKSFPDSPFTVVIFGSKTNLFPDLMSYKGRNVEVSGTVKEFKEKPQIVLNSTNDIKIVESPKTE